MDTLPSEEIKSRLDIVDVISGYIKLQRAGGSFKTVCPFHNENSPSFFVSPDKQIFNCFGCGKGGDMFSFVMEMEGIEFVDALRILAKQAGVELKRVDPKIQTERTTLQEICVDAARYFFKNLYSDAGKNALKYLEKRGLTKETIEEFKIGYSFESWDGLYNFLTLKGYKPEMIEKAGLLVVSNKSGKKKYFDRFRDRIMFPISDANGYIVGFTGRYLTKKENEGKYVNSPQTPVFDKSKILYGLEKAKVNIKKEGYALLVEGQMDVISCWQDGIKNAVASSGTALTQSQTKLLKRYSSNLKIAFDMDDAGDMATKRGIDVASGEGLNVSIVRIPDGKDPADFVFSHKGELKEILEKSMPIMEYYFETALAKHDPKDLDGKKKISEELLLNIKKIQNKVEMYHWLDRLAQILNTDVKYLEEDMASMKSDAYAKYTQPNIQIQETKTLKSNDGVFTSLMAFLIKDSSKLAVLEDSDFMDFLEENKKVSYGLINENLLSLFDFLRKCAKIGQISEILKKADETQKSLLNPVILQSEMIDDSIDIDFQINFCCKKIKEDILRLKRKNLHFKIKEAEEKGDAEATDKYLKELKQI